MVQQAISQTATMTKRRRRRRRKRGGGLCLQSRQVCERFVEVVLVIKAISHKARRRTIKRCVQQRQLETNSTQLLLGKVIFHFKEQLEFTASTERRSNWWKQESEEGCKEETAIINALFWLCLMTRNCTFDKERNPQFIQLNIQFQLVF